MDPISALGAAAAGAQFVGIAVKTLLGAAKFFQGIKDDSKRAVELLAWIEEELISMQRLLHPDSPVFASLTTAQYVQVAPCAINARKALDKVKTVLSPLVDDIGRLKDRDELGKKFMLLWKSLFTMKMMKDIESNLNTIRMLNATLLRELQICGFETQSLLCEQSAQVFSIVVELSKRDGELLRSMEQFSTLQRQTLEETKLSKDAFVHTLHALREAENDRYQELLRVQMTQFQAMQSMFRPQIDTTETLSKVGADNKYSSNDPDSGIASTQIVKRKSKIQSFKSLRCKCYTNKFSSVHTFRNFAFRTDWQPVQVCPLHGRVGQRSYSVEANLHPWTNGFFQLSFGMLFQGRTWSISRPLNFQGTVKRSESPIFKLIDEFISSCSTLHVRPGNLPPQCWEPGVLLNRNRKDRFPDLQLVWDGQKTKERLADVIRSIEEAVSSGVASYSDMDERGCTLLTELTLLFAYLGEVIFDVESEVLQLFQMAFRSNLDPTTRFSEFSDGRSYGVLYYGDPNLTLGDTIANYATSMGRISASLYEAFLNYEGLAESISDPNSVPRLWKAIISDSSLAEALGYSDLSLAVISRSLERLKNYVKVDSGKFSWDHPRYSPLELALGWPEGLQLLIVNDYADVFRAFRLACELHDITSAATILSSKDFTLFTARPYRPRGHIDTFRFIDFLETASGNMSIFRMTAETLWRRKDQIKVSWTDPSNRVHNLLLWRSKSEPARDAIIYDSLEKDCFSRETERLDKIFSSAAHSSSSFKVEHHQVLFDIGFTDVNTLCGGLGTPLIYKCRSDWSDIYSEESHENNKNFQTVAIWLLSRGASPKMSSGFTVYDGKYVHHFLAAAQDAGAGLDKRFSKILGQHSEKHLHDKCICSCSSIGCIPSFSFWKYSWLPHFRGTVDKQRLGRRLPNIRKWIHYWHYSEKDAEFIHREICRLEVFERLGMTHLCCRANNETREDRRNITLEDEDSKQNLDLLLQFYILTRKEYRKISIEAFWNFWWDNLDAILPPRKVPLHRFRNNQFEEEYIIFQSDLEKSRDDEWHETLEEAGYNDWNFQDVIWDHCTKVLLKAHAHRQRVAAWKRHRLVSKPRFGRSQPLKFLQKQPEEEWVS